MMKKFDIARGAVVSIIAGLTISFARAEDTFFNTASQLNIAEIRAGRLAEGKGNPEVSKIGKQMVVDYTIAENELIVLAKKLGLRVDSTLDTDHNNVLLKLNQLYGKSFDSTYMASQFLYHQESISLYSEESKTGIYPSAKAYAGKYLPKLQMNFQMFQGNERALKITMDSVEKK